MPYLIEAVESVRAQNYARVQHVFADGGSTDGSLDYIRGIQGTDSYEIVLLESANDKGVGDALNAAYKNSSGEIIFWLDSDDRLEPDAISHAVQFMLTNPEVSFVYGECNIIDESSEKIGSFIIRDFDKWEWVNRWHYIVFASMFFRREVAQQSGFLNDLGNDLDFYLRVARRFKLTRIDRVLASWRLNSKGISLSPSPRQKKIRLKRAREDWWLVLKHGGSLASPRALTYLILLIGRIPRPIRIKLSGAFRGLKLIDYVLKRGIAVTSPKTNYRFLPALVKDLSSHMRSKT
jgi:glycosyltransferase involved in cell wall biosynthesis